MRSQDVLLALRGILFTALVGSCGALVGGLVFDDRPAIVFGALALLGLPAIWRMVAKGHSTAASVTMLALFNTLTVYALVFGGGVQDPTAMLFPVLIIASGILLDGRLAAVASAIIVASCIGVGLAEYAGLIATNLSHELSGSDVLFQAILVIAVATLVSIMSRALRDSVRRSVTTHQSYEQIFNASGEGILVYDATARRVLEVNDAALAMFRYASASSLEFGLDALVGPGACFDRTSFEERLAAAGPVPTRFEWCAARREGDPIWLDVTVRSAVIRGHARVVCVLRDTSERRALEEQIHQADKLRAVGQLARGVAHDFNNQLTVILANAGLIEAGVEGDADLSEYTQSIIESSRRSADLTKQLLAFARKGQRRDEFFDVDELVAEVKVLLGRSIDKRIEIVHERASAPAVIRGDATFLQSALLNLGLNARDAMPDGGTLRFAVDVTSGASSDGARRVRVRVEDSGSGMSRDVQDHIFEPFYTTKAEGNGMGLAAVYGTVVAHDGGIGVESEPGRGTCFTIELPEADADDRLARRERKAESRRRFDGVRVLLAEDEPAVARATIRTLERFGCRVTHCPDGEAALAALQDDGDFDVAVLDHSMPRMTGSAVLDALRDRQQNVPVIVVSGYSESDESRRHQPQAFVGKPYTMSALTDALEIALKSARGAT